MLAKAVAPPCRNTLVFPPGLRRDGANGSTRVAVMTTSFVGFRPHAKRSKVDVEEWAGSGKEVKEWRGPLNERRNEEDKHRPRRRHCRKRGDHLVRQVCLPDWRVARRDAEHRHVGRWSSSAPELRA